MRIFLTAVLAAAYIIGIIFTLVTFTHIYSALFSVEESVQKSCYVRLATAAAAVASNGKPSTCQAEDMGAHALG